MRKEFVSAVTAVAKNDDRTIFLTGDLGYMALEPLRDEIGDRFINAGVAEQNLISVAAGLAHEGLLPICYSIAPFIVFRPAEQIRLDVCLHNLNVKIIGNGGGYGYGIMGSTHHALEDVAVLSSFQNMRCFIPWCNADVQTVTDAMFNYQGPSYLRLGAGELPQNATLSDFAPVRRVAVGEKVTVVAMGPVVINALKALEGLSPNTVDVFVVSQMPLPELSQELIESLRKTKRLVVVEEHIARGGVCEALALRILEAGISIEALIHHPALGYPNGRYGSQAYHQKINALDPESIRESLVKLLDEKS